MRSILFSSSAEATLPAAVARWGCARAMFEGEDAGAFAVATETAYRLCLAPISWQDLSPHAIPSFSVIWSPNPSRSSYYCCLRNGYVYQLDTTDDDTHMTSLTSFHPDVTPPSRIYEVLFQSYTSEGHKSIDPPRRISLHWDKMRLIPGRPGEVLFLLGITQSLYYSAFPGTSSPLSSPIQPPTSGYTFGTPVIELLAHQGRITSVEVSSCGHMLATGDEHGYVKLMMICRPESLKHTIQRSPHELGEKINFQCVEEDLRLNGLRAHFGPIFSVCWVNITEDLKQSKAYSRSMSSPENRTPWMYTDVEKVYYYLITGSNDRYVRVWSIMWSRIGIEVAPFAQFDVVSSPILSISSYTFLKPAPRAPFTRRTSSTVSPSCFEHLIGASTETGVVYLWKLPSSSEIDSCGQLISMIHSSKFPLVNLTLTVLNEKEMSTPSVIVVASDVQGTVRIHLSALLNVDEITNAKSDSNQLGHERKESLLFTLQGQASFNSPIIYCKFLEKTRSNSGDSELSIFLMSGEMKLYSILDLIQASRRAKEVDDTPDVVVDDISEISEHTQTKTIIPNREEPSDLLKNKIKKMTPEDVEYPAPPPIPIAPPTLPEFHSSPPFKPSSSPSKVGRKSPVKPSHPSKQSPKKSPSPSSALQQKTSTPEVTIPSEFSAPSLHTTKALGTYIQSQPAVDLDAISVSTIETTTTDRQIRANEIVNMSSRQRIYNDTLPKFTESEIERRMPQKSVLRPQIDKKWKSKLQSAMPTEECLNLMTPKDPLIHIQYVSRPLADPRNSDALRSIPLPDSPLPSHLYSCEVNLTQIFGEISASKTWEEMQRQGEESSYSVLEEEIGLSDRSPYILPIIRGDASFQFV